VALSTQRMEDIRPNNAAEDYTKAVRRAVSLMRKVLLLTSGKHDEIILAT